MSDCLSEKTEVPHEILKIVFSIFRREKLFLITFLFDLQANLAASSTMLDNFIILASVAANSTSEHRREEEKKDTTADLISYKY